MEPYIDDFLISAIHTLPIRTFASLGFSTKVALSNDSDLDKKYVTDYLVQARVYLPDGKPGQFHKDLGQLRPDKKLIINVNDITREQNSDQVIVFSLIPKRILETSSDKVHCRITLSELRFLVNSQGHQVEYCKSDGYSTGVLYAAGAFNYKKFHKEPPTTLLQAPKAFVSKHVDTLVTLTNSCPDPTYDQTHHLNCAITSGNGEVVCSWREVIAPFTSKVISVREALSKTTQKSQIDTDEVRFYCISGYCSTGLLIPLIFSHNSAVNTLAVEHTFGPWIYASAVTGEKRKASDAQFQESTLFNS